MKYSLRDRSPEAPQRQASPQVQVGPLDPRAYQAAMAAYANRKHQKTHLSPNDVSPMAVRRKPVPVSSETLPLSEQTLRKSLKSDGPSLWSGSNGRVVPAHTPATPSLRDKIPFLEKLQSHDTRAGSKYRIPGPLRPNTAPGHVRARTISTEIAHPRPQDRYPSDNRQSWSTKWIGKIRALKAKHDERRAHRAEDQAQDNTGACGTPRPRDPAHFGPWRQMMEEKLEQERRSSMEAHVSARVDDSDAYVVDVSTLTSPVGPNFRRISAISQEHQDENEIQPAVPERMPSRRVQFRPDSQATTFTQFMKAARAEQINASSVTDLAKHVACGRATARMMPSTELVHPSPTRVDSIFRCQTCGRFFPGQDIECRQCFTTGVVSDAPPPPPRKDTIYLATNGKTAKERLALKRRSSTSAIEGIDLSTLAHRAPDFDENVQELEDAIFDGPLVSNSTPPMTASSTCPDSPTSVYPESPSSAYPESQVSNKESFASFYRAVENHDMRLIDSGNPFDDPEARQIYEDVLIKLQQTDSTVKPATVKEGPDPRPMKRHEFGVFGEDASEYPFGRESMYTLADIEENERLLRGLALDSPSGGTAESRVRTRDPQSVFYGEIDSFYDEFFRKSRHPSDWV